MEEPDTLQLLKIICDVLAEHKVVELAMEFTGHDCHESFKPPLLYANNLLYPHQCERIPKPKSTAILFETRITLPDFCVNAGMDRTSTIMYFLAHAAGFFMPENYAFGNGGSGSFAINVNKQELRINTFIYDSDKRTTGSVVYKVFSANYIKPASGKIGANLKSIRKVRIH